jgi:apolipoprotein N-acyltransferase
MKELLTLTQANAIFGIALPLLGLVLGGAVFAVRKDRRLAGFCGGAPVLAGLLWWVYNAISAALGIDTVLNLLVNFALFIALGVAVGWLWKKTENAPLPPASEEGG